jgi:hypothetical protein
MDEGRVLIVNLGKGQLGADVSNVLGGLIVSCLMHAAYSREDLPEKDRKPFFLYIDEFHHFTTDAIAGMLSELRKYGVAVILANQHLGQLSEMVRAAIFGNVGTMLIFRVGADDAGVLAKYLAADIPQPRDLMKLANHEMFVRLMLRGTPTKPFSATSLLPCDQLMF